MDVRYVSCNNNKYILGQSLASIKSFVKQYEDVKTNTLYIKNSLYEEIFLYFNNGHTLNELPKDKCMHHYYTFAYSNGFPSDFPSYWFINTCLLCIDDEKRQLTPPNQSNTYIGYRSFKANIQHTNIYDFIKDYAIYKIDKKDITYNTLYIAYVDIFYKFDESVVNILLTKLIKMRNSILIMN